ncbi:MAG: bifunctional riboflavin kinase/FAD synthetase [Bacteroidota bacterium]
MQIFRSIDEITKLKKSVLTIGTFDGVHAGHKDIVTKLRDYAEENGSRDIVITFEPHPRTVVSDYNIRLLSTLEEKIELLESLGVGNLLILKFTEEFSQQSSKEFVENYVCNKIGAEHIIIGHDHKFGKDRGGDEHELKDLGKSHDFTVEIVEPVTKNGKVVSSTVIRNSLLNGDIDLASELLERNYCFHGKVVKGVSRGTILGFPTANINVENNRKLIPQNGVYVVECKVQDKKIYGVMNIGLRPTFADTKEVIIEVHLIEFNEDIYGEEVRVSVLKRLRDEKKFESKEELIYQIERDKRKTIQYVGSIIN